MAHPLYKVKSLSPIGIVQGNHFICAILSGQRDFSGIHLQENFNLDKHPRSAELRAYLKDTNLEENPIILNRACLNGIIATNFNLCFLEAEGIDCAGANLAGSLLDHALLRGAGLQSADLSGTSLEFADLHAAFLHRANCSNANLLGAYLHGSIMIDATFERANMTLSHLDSAYCLRAKFDFSNLTQAELTYGNFRNASFRGATLTGALLHRAHFRGVDKTEVNFNDARLIENAHWE